MSKKIKRDELDDPGFQMAPMIDIVFQLLIFFMVATGIVKYEAELAAKLPSKPTPSDKQEIIEQTMIEVTNDGRVIVNQKEFDSPDSKQMPQLRMMLQGLGMLSKKQIVIIKSARATRYERVIDVLNACAGANIRNVLFATSEKEAIKFQW